jgi:hypothetical protein
LLLSSCGSPDESSGSDKGGADSHSEPTITANPNPVPADSGPGTTTISWDTGDGSKGQVYFSINNQPERRWYSDRAKGSQNVAWINKGNVYEFRLYGGSNPVKLLASVKVTKK